MSSTGVNDFEKQEQLVQDFRANVQGILEPYHDDMFLARWLKARNYNLKKAEDMIRKSFSFRKQIGANSILTNYDLPEVYVKHPISFFLGFDKENSPVRLIMAGICDYKGFVQSLRLIEMMKLLTYFLEHDMSMVEEKKKQGSKVDMRSTFIIDFQYFSLNKFTSPSVRSTLQHLITMYQDNYPETLKKAYLVNVPQLFSFAFEILKGFLNEVTLSKIAVYNTGEWQDELRQSIDPELLPAFLGGKLTDPDGNPKCKHLINWEGKIDASFYLTQEQITGHDDPSLTKTTVQKRDILQVPVEVQVPGSLLTWTFMTKEHNIEFGLFLKEDKGGDPTELVPVEAMDCHLIPEEGEHLCEKAGTYVFHFDNSKSWIRAKKLAYKVRVQTPNEIILP